MNTDPFISNVAAACHNTLRMLHRRFAVPAWFVGLEADVGDSVQVVCVAGDGYGMGAGMVIRRDELGACVLFPLVSADGNRFGVLGAIGVAPDFELSPDDRHLIDVVSETLGHSIAARHALERERCRADRAEQAAVTDTLTGLYNRRGWERLVAAEESRCRRHGRAAAVISFDLDGLKQVNDRLGHEAGDELIRSAARALRSSVRDQDVVARLGGDEFVVLGVECDDVKALASSVQCALADAGVSASIGWAVRRGLAGLEQAQRDADEAMYHSKRARAFPGHRTRGGSGAKARHAVA